ncbi:MAG: GIY-YIG nuclease family protein [Vicinamibacteria bacterium]
MLCCRDGSLYSGAAKDLAARFRQHEKGTASRYTRARRPVRLVWSRRVRTWGHALRTEYRLKQLTRAEKDRLVAGAAWRIDGRPRAAR